MLGRSTLTCALEAALGVRVWLDTCSLWRNVASLAVSRALRGVFSQEIGGTGRFPREKDRSVLTFLGGVSPNRPDPLLPTTITGMTLEPVTTSGSAITQGAVGQAKARVVLFSDDVETRAAVRRAVGRRASKDTGLIEWLEVATAEAMFAAIAQGGYDLLVLDGETAKVGSFGLAREIKDTYFDAPPILLLVARPEDAWIAAWSQAEGIVPFPLRPAELADSVAALLREHAKA